LELTVSADNASLKGKKQEKHDVPEGPKVTIYLIIFYQNLNCGFYA
jgi:hypothetical protein